MEENWLRLTRFPSESRPKKLLMQRMDMRQRFDVDFRAELWYDGGLTSESLLVYRVQYFVCGGEQNGAPYPPEVFAGA